MSGSTESEPLAEPGGQPEVAAPPEAEALAPPSGEPAGLIPGRRLPRSTWLVAIFGALILPVAVAAGLTWFAAVSTNHSSDAASARIVSAADMEREYGIKVNLVTVTAAGGLVDLRFTVVDKDKAMAVLHDGDNMPQLVVEPSATVIRAPTGMRHKVTILDGGSYFILYSNPGGAVQAGTSVSVVIGDIRLEPIAAQS